MSPDPLRDPRFPDRPQSPDFWRITEVVNQQDGRSTEGQQEMDQVIGDIVDGEAVAYMAVQRARMVQRESGLSENKVLTQMMAAIWVDAFTVGVRFERAGGHRAE